ncbi:MAG TPA: TonB-dependent receptor [Steroidobacteraceae bacterium]|nr:TonB-dependent receptor [Steroidobacteraceae bacterium]
MQSSRRAFPLLRPRAALAALVIGAFPAPGLAGQAPSEQPAASPSPPAAKPVDRPAPLVNEVVVTGERPAVETRVDRKIYNLSRELQATAGSAADVLRNLPSVSIDIDGNPSLRGDPGVLILIDGRRAPQFNNDDRGTALQQLGADSIDRIEIIPNPPANFKRDGSAGIINIITKRPSGSHTAAAQASVGSRGRYNLSTSQGAQWGKLSLRGSAGLRHDLRIRDIESRRIVRDPASEAVLSDRQFEAAAENDRLSKTITLGADYDMSAVDRLSAEGSYFRRDADASFDDSTLVLDSGGSPTNQFDRSRREREHEYGSSAMLRYHRAGESDGDGLSISAERSEYSEHQPLRYTNTYFIPVQAPTSQNQVFDEGEVTREFSVDYVMTLSASSKFVSGYDLQRDDNAYDNLQTIPVNLGGVGAPDPDFTNLFKYDQTIHAVYGSYERPLGRWTVLAGLRLEQTDISTNQVTSGAHSGQDYFRAYPTLHFADKLNEQQMLMFSYGRRISRPQGSQNLNPFRRQQDAATLREGNPDLAPSEIDSLEAGWSYNEGRTSLGTTLYARRDRNNVTYVSTPISPTVVLIRPENLGESVSGGLELTASGRLGKQLDYNFSGNAYYNEIDASNLGFAGTRSAFAYEAKAALNWRASGQDTLQINLGSSGKRLTPQGYLRGNTALDLGFRHQLRPNFSITATVSDVFANRRFESVLETPELSDSTRMRQPGRIVYVGVSWVLAGAKQEQDENFEYGE